MRIWEKYLDPRDLRVYSGAGLGKSYGLGKKPALIIVDVQYGFTGDGPEPIEESIKKYPTSCGEAAWEAMPYIRKVLDVAREKGFPVCFTVIAGSRSVSNDCVGIKGNFFDHPLYLEGEKGSRVVDDIAPIKGELVISKKKPSAFFETELNSFLIKHNVDSVIVTGTTTSGCVRATVIDAFSNNYKVVVPEECTFDRGITSHAINLFDMQQKYADVLPTDEVIQLMKSID